MVQLPEFGLIGLGVMGRGLAINYLKHSDARSITVYNRTAAKTDAFVEAYGSEYDIRAAYDLASFVDQIARPRKIMIMIAGSTAALEATVNALSEFLEEGDIIIDGANTPYQYTESWQKDWAGTGFHYIGVGISGGEEGAKNGASLMPSGDREAYDQVAHIIEAMAAPDPDGLPCTAYIGPGGSGHFVKTVHNGIEYGIMDVIGSVVEALRQHYSDPQIANILEDLSGEGVGSYLLESAITILRKQNPELTYESMYHRILDVAGHKGTGLWTVQAALQHGVAVPVIDGALSARMQSADPDYRKEMAALYADMPRVPKPIVAYTRAEIIAALYCGYVAAYEQGFALIKKASDEFGWEISLPTVARIWKNGCIIRSEMLDPIQEALSAEDYRSLMASKQFVAPLKQHIPALRGMVAAAVRQGLPVHSLAATANYFATAQRGLLEQTQFIQALRDLFGAHGYTDIGTGEQCHTEWLK